MERIPNERYNMQRLDYNTITVVEACNLLSFLDGFMDADKQCLIIK